MDKLEIRAKALELAIQILGPNYEKQIADIDKMRLKHLTVWQQLFIAYKDLADLIEHYILPNG